MNHSSANLSTSRRSGKVVFVSMMFIFVLVIFVEFLCCGDRAYAFSRCDKAEAQLAALNTHKAIKDAPKAGVVKGVVYNPPSSCAVVDETIVHEGDKIHDVVVVAIHNNLVEFAKDGVTWQQDVLDAPNAAWTNPAEDNSRFAK